MAHITWYSKGINHVEVPVTACKLSDLNLRFIRPTDISDVWKLCSECFPIEYPQSWYEEVTSNPKFYSLVAVHEGQIIGLIIAEVKDFLHLCQEDRNIISPCLGNATEVAYILSLAVNKNYRRNGIASLLLDKLINFLSSKDYSTCKAIFLHVLTTNAAAINFYERKRFRLHTFLPYYYFIRGKCKDGFTYVLYINGGHPPNGLLDTIKCTFRVACESEAAMWTWDKIVSAIQWALPVTRKVTANNEAILEIRT